MEEEVTEPELMTLPRWVKPALIAAGAVAAVFLMLTVWAWLGWQADSEAARRAELDREATQAKLEAITTQATQAIAEANQRATEALARASEAQARERAALDRAAAILVQRREDLARVPQLSDTSLTVAARDDLLAAYPETTGAEISWTGSDFVLSRPATEAAVKGWREVLSLRAEVAEIRTANAELRGQVAELMKAISAENDKVKALEARIQGFEDLQRADAARITALEDLLSSERRRARVRLWRDRTISAAGIVASVLIAMSVAS